jgi:hypothetical protein
MTPELLQEANQRFGVGPEPTFMSPDTFKSHARLPYTWNAFQTSRR